MKITPYSIPFYSSLRVALSNHLPLIFLLRSFLPPKKFYRSRVPDSNILYSDNLQIYCLISDVQQFHVNAMMRNYNCSNATEMAS